MGILGVIGLIFKIIGWILLGLLLLVLALLAIVLFVPIRYQASMEREGKDLTVKAKVHYLLHLIRVPITFENNKLTIRAKVLFFTLYSNVEGEKKPRKKKEKKETAKVDETKTDEAKIDEAKTDKSKTDEAKIDLSEGNEQAENAVNDESSESPQNEKEICDREIEEAVQSDVREDTAQDIAQERPIGKLSGILYDIKKKINSLSEKMKGIFDKIKGIIEKVIGLKEKIRTKVVGLKENLAKKKGKLGTYLEFAKKADTKATLKNAGKTIFRLIKHVLPYKIKGKITFGTGDPYSMGQALSALGILYPMYAKKFQVTADFDTAELRIDGSVKIKGRIRAISLLIPLLKLWFNKQTKKTLKGWKKIKKELADAE